MRIEGSVPGDRHEHDEDSGVIVCARCVRRPRDADDHAVWAAFEEGAVCPGCLTLTEVEQLRESG
jgi:hypothetical protein